MKKNQCKMCGRNIPPLDSYPAEHCWICCRVIAEHGHSRYYYLKKEGYLEEITELAGVCPFSEKEKIKAFGKKYNLVEEEIVAYYG